MGIEDRPERNMRRMPDVFDSDFALPDTQFVQFIFKDRESMKAAAEAFSASHVGEMMAMHQTDPHLVVSRAGDSDSARLFLDFLHQRADEGTMQKGNVGVCGLNRMPE